MSAGLLAGMVLLAGLLCSVPLTAGRPGLVRKVLPVGNLAPGIRWSWHWQVIAYGQPPATQHKVSSNLCQLYCRPVASETHHARPSPRSNSQQHRLKGGSCSPCWPLRRATTWPGTTEALALVSDSQPREFQRASRPWTWESLRRAQRVRQAGTLAEAGDIS